MGNVFEFSSIRVVVVENYKECQIKDMFLSNTPRSPKAPELQQPLPRCALSSPPTLFLSLLVAHQPLFFSLFPPGGFNLYTPYCTGGSGKHIQILPRNDLRTTFHLAHPWAVRTSSLRPPGCQAYVCLRVVKPTSAFVVPVMRAAQ